MFSQKVLCFFSQDMNDVTYDLIQRRDVNWRELNQQVASGKWQVACSICVKDKLDGGDMRKSVLDYSVKTRNGERGEGVSSHIDHGRNVSVMGEQVLSSGPSTDQGFGN